MSDSGPAEQAVAADLFSVRFQAGVKRRQWRQVSYAFPILIVAVAALEPDGESSEYSFRFELTGFPGVAPEVRIWNTETDTLLEPTRRPKGSNRVLEAFKNWGVGSIYRPWDRFGSAHNNWAAIHPTLAWNAKRDLTFILEDIHGLLTSNSAALNDRPAA